MDPISQRFIKSQFLRVDAKETFQKQIESLAYSRPLLVFTGSPAAKNFGIVKNLTKKNLGSLDM